MENFYHFVSNFNCSIFFKSNFIEMKTLIILISLILFSCGNAEKEQAEFLTDILDRKQQLLDYHKKAWAVFDFDRDFYIEKYRELEYEVKQMEPPNGYDKGITIKQQLLDVIVKEVEYFEREKSGELDKKKNESPELYEVYRLADIAIKETIKYNTIEGVDRVTLNIKDEFRRIDKEK